MQWNKNPVQLNLKTKNKKGEMTSLYEVHIINNGLLKHLFI